MSGAVGGPGGGGPGGGVRDTLAALRDGRIQGDDGRLRAATQLLEGVFQQEMFKAMRSTVPEGGAIPGGAGEEMFSGLLDQYLSDAAAQGDPRGIGAALYRYFVGPQTSEGSEP